MDVIFPEWQKRNMEKPPETSLQKRLRLRMDMLELNAYQTALRAGLGDSFVRDILRGKTRSPSAENLAKLAEALQTTPEWFLSPEKGDTQVAPLSTPMVGLEVVGDIQAGNWRDVSLLDDNQEPEIVPVARDPRFPLSKQYVLRVVGDSMNLRYPEFSYVHCVQFLGSGIPMKMGLVVHVERYNGSLVEVTLKEVTALDGQTVLSPRSSNPKHKPLILEGDGGTEIVIKGVVIGSYQREVI